jgi:N-acetylglucosamine kinase-like BadF-type ATPase
VLAVDGGNSKTDVALVAADGSLLASVRGPGMDAQRDGVAETIGALGGLVTEAAGRAGLVFPGRSPVAAHLSACIANADLPEEEEEVCAALREQGWSQTTSVVNDTFAVLRAGLAAPGPGGQQDTGAHWGVAVTCGAGINCVALAPDGRSTRYLALGGISGDWGGGFGLGRATLWWAIRAEDGRGPATALREAVAGHFGAGTVRDVTVRIHQGQITEDELLDLAPVLLATAHRGDRVARDLVRRQADEICLMILAAMRRLGLTGLATPVVLGGGLLTARDPLLIGGIEAGLAAAAPGAAAAIIDVPPVAGAALLGLDQAGAGPAALARLRSAYAPAAHPGCGARKGRTPCREVRPLPGAGRRRRRQAAVRSAVAAAAPLAGVPVTTSWCTTFSVVTSCAVRSASAITPTRMASASTSHISTLPENTSAAISDHSPASASSPCPALRPALRVSAADAAASTVRPVNTPNPTQPATGAVNASAAATPNAPAITNRLSRMNLLLSFITSTSMTLTRSGSVCSTTSGGSGPAPGTGCLRRLVALPVPLGKPLRITAAHKRACPPALSGASRKR